MRKYILLVLLFVLPACALLPASAPAGSPPTTVASTQATHPLGPTTSSPSGPYGLTVVNNFLPAARASSPFIGELFQDQTYANPNIAALTFRTSWSDLEPTQDGYSWSKLDELFDKAEQHGKWVELVLIPGMGTPAWALQGVQTDSFSILYGPGKGQLMPMPLPWDATYLQRWFSFLAAVSARYQSRPSFLKIAADGPTAMTGEMTLPDTPSDLCTWIKDGYTSQRLIDTWKEVFANFARIFPRQYFSLALYPPLPIVNSTRCANGKPAGTDQDESRRVRAAIVALGVDGYPERFVLQDNGLRAANTLEPTAVDQFVGSYSGKVLIGFQLATSAMTDPMYMGNVSDGATALKNSLQKGILAHAQFLEVYEPDVLNPAAQPVLAGIAAQLAAPAQ